MTRRTGEFDVIVVGAGMVGAATALALAQDGFEVALVETQASELWNADDDVDARVVALAPDAVQLFQSLGVWDEIVRKRASAYQRMHVWDALAPGEVVFDAAEQGEAALGWIVENRLIQSVLWSALTASFDNGIAPTVIHPAEVIEIENQPEVVSVTLADGRRLRARMLVAADGANSPLRAKLGISVSERDYAQRAVVAHVSTTRAHEATAWQRFQPGGTLAFLPLNDGRSSIVWSLPTAEAVRVLALDEASFMAELGCAFDFRLGPVISTSKRYAFPLRLRLAKRYLAGRAVLIGDAAHAVHPLAGQGVNLGLRDVANLRAQLIKARTRNVDIGSVHVLRRYERERRSENLLAARGMDLIERVSTPSSAILSGVRGLALSGVARIGPLRRWLGSLAAGRA